MTKVAARARCDCCGRRRPIAQRLGRWRWCAPCAEKLELARGLVLDQAERERLNK